MPHHVVILGAGPTGLATAHRLRRLRPDWRLTVLEKDPVAGGKVRTVRRDGFVVEGGPNGFLSNAPQTLALVRELGLEGELQEASEAARRRYLYRGGGLRPLPGSPPAALRSELLSPTGKARALAELVLGSRSDREESVHDFLARHFGRELAERLGGAMVAGVAAGDPRALSVDALFPRLRELEREHGSVLRGMIRSTRAPGRLTSLRGGTGRLLEALAEELGGALRTGVEAVALARGPDGFELTLRGGERLAADAVVLTVPAFAAASLLEPLAPAAAVLGEIPYAPVRVFGLGYERVDVPHPLDGFGFLVPRGQGLRSLGVLWSSALFPDRAPAGRVLLRVLAGGSTDPRFAELGSAEALAAVRRDLRVAMGVVAEPVLVEEWNWRRGIPQYTLGHGARVARAEAALADLPGLVLAGNAYRGVGLNDCVRDAERAAARVAGAPA